MSMDKEIRPAGNGTDQEETDGLFPNILAAESDKFTAYVQGVYVVVVETAGERMRRRVYLNLPSAQRAAGRAADRGHDVRLFLARLDVVGVEQ